MACAPPPSTIDLLVNGNPALADAMRSAWPSLVESAPMGTRLRLWSILLGDKAHALNEYLHRIWPTGSAALIVDGYVRVHTDTLALLAAALDASPDALAATGVPGSGRSAGRLRTQMLAEGGLHGNCFLLGEAALQALRDMAFRLPLGLYRTDSTLGAALSFGLDPARHDWQPLRFIRIEPNARWDVDAKPWWRPSELRAHWRRRQRQAAGALENRAVRYLYAERRLPPASLPGTVADLVLGWQSNHAEACAALLRSNPGTRAAWPRITAPRDWSAAQHQPSLLATTHG